MRIGYLGVGNMGQPMAGKLLDAGHELWVYDVREDAMRPLLERQARRAASPKALADACDTVVVSLPTLEIFRRALAGPDGLLAGKALRTLVNTCTIGGPFVREVEASCSATGVTVIDVPISGGVTGAKAGTLAVMVSGDPAKVEELMPLLRLWGKTIVIALPGTFDFGATIEILMKDVDLAIAQGEELGVPMWVCQAVRLVLKHGVFQGRAQQDLSRIVQIIEDGTRKQ
jgi:3-hydroxyisobutyrate dehydrogenase-like beta-hydroxyacid dehydrogenase